MCSCHEPWTAADVKTELKGDTLKDVNTSLFSLFCLTNCFPELDQVGLTKQEVRWLEFSVSFQHKYGYIRVETNQKRTFGITVDYVSQAGLSCCRSTNSVEALTVTRLLPRLTMIGE